MTCPAHRTRLAVTAWPRGEERLAQGVQPCAGCPFRGCEDCLWQGGPTRRDGEPIPGLICDNEGSATHAVPPHPAANRTGGVAEPKPLDRRFDGMSVATPAPADYPRRVT